MDRRRFRFLSALFLLPIAVAAATSSCGSTIIIEDCDFSGQGDDSVNIAAHWLQPVAQPDAVTLDIAFAYASVYYQDCVVAGMELSFRDRTTLREFARRRVLSVTQDGALGLTDARYVMDKYPDGARAFHRFRDGEFSSCNLYAFLTPRAFKAAAIFNGGGQFGKKPKRLIGAFGLLAFLVYKSRLVRVRPFLRFLSRAIGVSTVPVFLPFAEGPIDIDRMSDWKLAERVIREREAA